MKEGRKNENWGTNIKNEDNEDRNETKEKNIKEKGTTEWRKKTRRTETRREKGVKTKHKGQRNGGRWYVCYHEKYSVPCFIFYILRASCAVSCRPSSHRMPLPDPSLISPPLRFPSPFTPSPFHTHVPLFIHLHLVHLFVFYKARKIIFPTVFFSHLFKCSVWFSAHDALFFCFLFFTFQKNINAVTVTSHFLPVQVQVIFTLLNAHNVTCTFFFQLFPFHHHHHHHHQSPITTTITRHHHFHRVLFLP